MKEELLLKLVDRLLETGGEVVSKINSEERGWQIVVLDRGWVIVGLVSICGEDVRICNSYHIRRWGTSKGLGELINGPLAETKLDYCGEVTTHKMCLNHFIDCEDAKWNEHRKT